MYKKAAALLWKHRSVVATMISEEDLFVLIPFNTFMEEKNTKRQVELENVEDRASATEKQNPKEPLVAKAPTPHWRLWLTTLILITTSLFTWKRVYPVETVSNVCSNS